MKNLTVRRVPEALADALERERQRRGTSLNQAVIDLLAQALGVHGTRSNGLAALAGTWSEEEFQRFDDTVGAFEEVDPDLWK